MKIAKEGEERNCDALLTVEEVAFNKNQKEINDTSDMLRQLEAFEPMLWRLRTEER
jgi:hypothetical protein